MMTTSKAAAAVEEAGKTATTILQPGQECCMCGDFGVPSEIFRCEVCQFRSQHRYCSNLYPKSEAYRLCNWCLLSSKDESGDKTQNSLNSSSSNKTNNTSDQDDVKTIKKKNENHGSLRKGSVKLHDIKNSIKKQKSPERLQLLAARKRITTTTATTTTTSDTKEDKLRRTKSSGAISNGTGNGNGMIRKPVFRNKVRRYKLLDEVSSL